MKTNFVKKKALKKAPRYTAAFSVFADSIPFQSAERHFRIIFGFYPGKGKGCVG
jgi:hypothetical protein